MLTHEPPDWHRLVSPVLTFDVKKAAPAIRRISDGTVSFQRPNDCTYAGLEMRPDNYKNPHLSRLGKILQKLHKKNGHLFGRFKFIPGIGSGHLTWPGTGRDITFDTPVKVTLMACDAEDDGPPVLRYGRSTQRWHPTHILDEFIKGVKCSSVELKRTTCPPGSQCY
jgi:hypothetical protein